MTRCALTAQAPAVLRVIFHDAGTFDAQAGDGGANASVQFELSRPENKGLKRGLNCVTEVWRKVPRRVVGEVAASQSDLITRGCHDWLPTCRR